jgi:hypothetical protein
MTDKRKRVYQSETLGVPPLQMVLVHHERRQREPVQQPQPAPPPEEERKKEALVQRIIEHLEKK